MADSTKKTGGLIGITVVAAAVGAVTAILCTKKTGSEVRHDIREQMEKTKRDVRDRAQSLRAKAEDTANDVKEKAQQKADELSEEARKKSEDFKSALDEAERKRKS